MKSNPFIHFIREVHGKFQTSVFGTAQGGQNSQQIAFLRQLQREMKAEEVMSVPLEEFSAVVFDIETTGFFPEQGNEIISIGAVKVKGGEMLEDERFYTLVRHENGLPDEISTLTGITEAELERAPALEEALIQFFKFVKGDTLVAHHSAHEKKFMQHASWKHFRAPFKHRIVDTSFLQRIAEPHTDFVRLEDLCEHRSIPVTDRHHALGDAVMTAKLWCGYIEDVKKEGCRNLRDIYERIAAG
ncbi:MULTISPECIES: exonuclease domain-containing protein [Metabacillus]|uniref:Exonuclease n=1 Tax=Metabacillus indicus TaxID=246786 RepID=A0A084GXG9_METID|nr:MULTISPECIES: exonuclease domain-containing protein [Metabacillus]KEZ52031.1 exonuclease [Metabacillus indicus]